MLTEGILMRRWVGCWTEPPTSRFGAPSKSGKSWLRQRVVSNPITVQCRLRKPFTDIYVDALSQLNIALQIKESRQGVFKGSLSASGEMGTALLAQAGISASFGKDSSTNTETKLAGHDISDLRYISDLIKASDRRLVIEDFHYMSTDDRRGFAFTLAVAFLGDTL
jgi:hypothetical protein